LRAAGVERVLWYNLKDSDPDHGLGLISYGSGNTDYNARKDAFNAFTTMNEQLAGIRSTERLFLDQPVGATSSADLIVQSAAETYGVRFWKGDGSAVDVLWSLQNETIQVLTSWNIAGVLTELTGESQVIAPDGYIFHIEVSERPIFLHHTPGSLNADTGFRPNPDGYSFANYNLLIPISDLYNPYDFTRDDLRRLFGDESVCVRGTSGNHCSLKTTAFAWLDAVNRQMNRAGHCLGISITSLRFFSDIDHPANFSGLFSSPETTYEIEKGNIKRHIAFYNVLQNLPQIHEIRRTTRNLTAGAFLAELSAAMKEEDYPVLHLFNLDSNQRVQGHAVVPYRIVQNDTQKSLYSIQVYDSNFRGDPRYGTVSINTNDQTWSYRSEGVEYDGTTRGQLEFVRLSEYNRASENPGNYCPNWCTAPALADEIPTNEIWSIGEGGVLISNQQGQRIGVVDGQWVEEIPGATMSRLFGGIQDVEPVYHLPVDGVYTIQVNGNNFNVSQTETRSITQFGSGFAITVDDVAAQDKITIAPDGSEVSYQAGSGNDPSLMIAMDEANDSYLFEIREADVIRGQTVTGQINPDQGHLVFNTDQGSSVSYELAVSRVSADGEQTFVHHNVSVSAGDTHYVNYESWDGAGEMLLEIDQGSDGSIDQTLMMSNQSNLVYLPFVSSNQQ
jgi:hypothetical protein